MLFIQLFMLLLNS